MPKMTGGQALVRSIYREGVSVVFGLPGAGQYHAVDALYQEPEIRYVAVRHEQATSYMADGYARISGHIGAVLVVPGPGLYNATAGIATAHAVSSPMLVVTGEDKGESKDRALGGEQVDALRSITKWTGRARHPNEIPALVHEAFRHLRAGRPRPVEIEIPGDTLATVSDVELLEPAISIRSSAVQSEVEAAARMLAASQRPVIWAGGGVHRSRASEALAALAEHLQAAVVTSANGKGAISDRHPLSLGLAEMRYAPLAEWLSGRDLILAVGTRTDFSKSKHRVIQIDVDSGQITRGDHVVGLVGDARASLEQLGRMVMSLTPRRPPADAEIRGLNAARFDPTIQLQPQWNLIKAVRAAMPDDGILVQGMNQMGYYSRNYFPVFEPGSYLTASYFGTLGHAFPVALGAKIAAPARAVVVLSGDGGFLYNSQELATAVQYGINVVTIVFNDNAFGNVLRAQMEQFNGHVLGTRLHNPDFVRLAEAYGVRAFRAHGAGDLEAALRDALATDAPALIEVPVGMMDREY